VLQPSPGLLVSPQDIGSAQGASERFSRDRSKLEAGCCATGCVDLFRVNDSIRKATDLRHDRDSAISQGAKLGQAAWFEA
jgi:hypothetical protein